MAANEAVSLFNKLIKTLDNEKTAVEKKDMELLEKTGSEIEQLIKEIKAAGTPQEAGNGVAELAAEASRKRKENAELIQALLEETNLQLGTVRRVKQVHTAYSHGHSSPEMYVKKNC